MLGSFPLVGIDLFEPVDFWLGILLAAACAVAAFLALDLIVEYLRGRKKGE